MRYEAHKTTNTDILIDIYQNKLQPHAKQSVVNHSQSCDQFYISPSLFIPFGTIWNI